MAERYPRVFVVAQSFHYFTLWCQVDCDPPENPRDPKFVICTSWDQVQRRMAGWRWQEGDSVVRLGDVDWKLEREFDMQLRMMGCPKLR